MPWQEARRDDNMKIQKIKEEGNKNDTIIRGSDGCAFIWHCSYTDPPAEGSSNTTKGKK